jgi:dihydrofolate reductase
MSKVRSFISMSLDGFVAGPHQSEEHPLGVGGMQLHQWLLPLAAFRRAHGEQGGDTNASTPVVERWFTGVGAGVMGRNMFGGGPGPWGEDPWNGWWGDDPPFHMPVYVVTHHPREPLALGDTTFTFVTEGVESAVAQARQAAGDQDVTIGGGASVIQQCLRAGLVDELGISVTPVLLGAGERLFDNLDGAELRLEQLRAIEAPGVTHLTYRVTAGA